MESSELIKKEPSIVGSKADVSIKTGLYKGEYASRVEDINGDVWKLAHPFMGGGLFPLYRGIEVFISVNTASGASYKAAASVLGTVREEGVPILVVRIQGEVDRLQRRQFVRVPCIIDGWLSPLSDIPELGIRRWLVGHATDISLGGVRFSLPENIQGKFNGMSRAMVRLAVEDQDYYLPCKVAVSRFNEASECTELGLVFEILPGIVEKDLSRFIRRQELASRNDRKR